MQNEPGGGDPACWELLTVRIEERMSMREIRGFWEAGRKWDCRGGNGRKYTVG